MAGSDELEDKDDSLEKIVEKEEKKEEKFEEPKIEDIVYVLKKIDKKYLENVKEEITELASVTARFFPFMSDALKDYSIKILNKRLTIFKKKCEEHKEFKHNLPKYIKEYAQNLKNQHYDLFVQNVKNKAIEKPEINREDILFYLNDYKP